MPRCPSGLGARRRNRGPVQGAVSRRGRSSRCGDKRRVFLVRPPDGRLSSPLAVEVVRAQGGRRGR
eukprot:1871770-Pyramimonas_sp.AAC.1